MKAYADRPTEPPAQGYFNGGARADLAAQAQEAGRQLARLLPQDNSPLKLVTDDNRHEMISLPPQALRQMLEILTHLGQGNTVTVVPQRAELSTQEVADYLNVSRPYVVKLIESGQLPARKVGTRRRVLFQDLLKFDEEDRKIRRAALDELHQIDQDLGFTVPLE